MVVEVIEHRGCAGGFTEERAEVPKRVGPQHRVPCRKRDGDVFVLVGVDVEMVMPELGHHLAQLGAGVHGADERCRYHFVRGAHAFGPGDGA